ncbi:MAG TPA: YtxH domain-containing protein [Armatimonadetes bacterium]|nr:YtxH domain-containing protein [Armatimonadota bacterium]
MAEEIRPTEETPALPPPEEEWESTLLSSLLVAGALGFAVGLTAGLLLAPKSGRELRRELFGGMEELPATPQALREQVERLSVRLTRSLEQFSQQVDECRRLLNVVSEEIEGEVIEEPEEGETA